MVSSFFVTSDHLSERVVVELQTRRNRRKTRDEEQRDRGLDDREQDDGGNGDLGQAEEAE